jgi:TIR domain-containing protein
MTDFTEAWIDSTVFDGNDLSEAIGLEDVEYELPCTLSIDTIRVSKGKIPEVFLRGCGSSDWEIEEAKLYNLDLSNEEINEILYKIHDLRANQPIQISRLFISYSQIDSAFVDKLEEYLNKKGIRFWRDVRHATAGRLEKQIDRAIRQNPDVLCPVALDDSWKSSPWPKRVMEQVMEYNILDFSAWKDDSKFGGIFNKLIDGLELFYKG